MDVSIIIVNYNTTKLVIDCINSIYVHSTNIVFEIIVVDNCSPDRSIEKITQIFPDITLVLNDKNNGFGAANNLGNKYAKGKYLFLLNSDTLLLDNALEQFYDFMENTPDAGICGGNLLTKDLKPNMSFLQLKPCLFYQINELFFEVFTRIIYYKNYRYSTKNHVSEIKGFIIGADFFVRKELFDQVNGFDEDFFMYYEEVELTYRIEKLNYKSYVIPTIKIIHLEGGSTTISTNKLKRMRESQKLYYSKTGQKYYTIVSNLDKLIYCRDKIKNALKS